MRYFITRSGLFLVVGILICGIGISGCGKSEEAPQKQNSTQTRAMVPGTVGQQDASTADGQSGTPAAGTAASGTTTPAEHPAGQHPDPSTNLQSAQDALNTARNIARDTAAPPDAPSSSAVRKPEQPGRISPPAPPTRPASPTASPTTSPTTSPTRTAPPAPPIPGNGRFSLQLGSYNTAAYAEKKAQELRVQGHPATVERAEVWGRIYYRVFIRGLADRTSAEILGDELRIEMGLDYLVRERK
ncbi:hypothetical protein CSA17_01235 [bacterium DOLJORAL78_65_58]|nr:MAG: hypothetical protein CSB20_00390 [bacterium DOLZORAL124_64_63]PIE76623.1 MAG: hypothetical protein CSA17_01235 [bacterium DOLJORAL78_65_58]